MLLLAGFALLTFGVAVAVGPQGLDLGLAGSAVQAAVMAVALAVVWVRLLRHLDEAYVRPIQQILHAVQDLRDGCKDVRVREAGAPVVQALAEKVNQASASVRQREQLSQANLMSVEVAFDRIHSVLHSLSEAVMLVDRKGRLVMANPPARALLRGNGKPLEGQPVMSLLSGELRERVAQGVRRNQERQLGLFQIMDLHVGERFYDLSVAEAHSARGGKAFGTVITLVDVTRNHEVSRLKDELLSSVSHELRTPLTNICAFTEILSQVTPDSGEDWEEFVSIVGNETHRLQELVDDILEHSRVQSGEFEPALEQVDIGELAGEALEPFGRAALASGIVLELEKAGADLHAEADADSVRRVLARLLHNALKFTPAGGRVRVSVLDCDKGVELSVDDSGEGIAPEHRETVFESFKQIGDHLTEKPQGTGLGLPICRGLVDAMRGIIWCEDSALGGACFRVVLPKASDKPSAGPAFESEESEAAGSDDMAEFAAELAQDFEQSRSESAFGASGSAGLWRGIGGSATQRAAGDQGEAEPRDGR